MLIQCRSGLWCKSLSGPASCLLPGDGPDLQETVLEFTVKRIHFFNRNIWSSLFWLVCICSLGSVSSSWGQMTAEEFGQRLEQMERENETLRQQIAEAQTETSSGTSVSEGGASSLSLGMDAVSSDAPAAASDAKTGAESEDLPSLPVLDLEKKDRLVSVVSDYDSIMLNMAQESESQVSEIPTPLPRSRPVPPPPPPPPWWRWWL